MHSCAVVIDAVPGGILYEEGIADVLGIGDDRSGCNSLEPGLSVGCVDAVVIGLHDIRP